VLVLDRTESGGDRNPLLDLVGLVDDTDGPEDVAHRHDDYLYGGGSRPVNRSA
jgi:hypothetical protein